MKSIFKNAIFAAALMLGAASISNAQVKVGANPASIGTNSNLEVEAANGNKTIVDKATGKVTIQDGTQGIDKVLTSNDTGVASWKSFGEAKVPTTVFVGTSDATLLIGASNAGTVGSRVTLVPTPSYISNWDAAQKAFVVPTAGYYRVEYISQFSTTNTANGFVIMVVKAKLSPSSNEAFVSNNYGTRTLSETAYFNAGDLIYAHIWASSTGNAYVYKSAMTITSIPN